jgi:hypothetical protein
MATWRESFSKALHFTSGIQARNYVQHACVITSFVRPPPPARLIS